MTNKEQERKALQQIRRIVAGLGENSYVATALDGCFEIAEQNIDNDWACSMKQRAESAEQSAEVVRLAKRAAEDAVKRWRDIADKNQREMEKAQQAAADLRVELEKTRGELNQNREFIENAAKFYRRRISELERLMLGAADVMERLSDTPADIGYSAALKNYRAYKAERAELLGELKKLGSE